MAYTVSSPCHLLGMLWVSWGIVSRASLLPDDRAEGPASLLSPILPGGHMLWESLPF